MCSFAISACFGRFGHPPRWIWWTLHNHKACHGDETRAEDCGPAASSPSSHQRSWTGLGHITAAVEVRLSQLAVIISHLTQRERLVWNMNEDDKNCEITANQSVVPERIINASTPINVPAERSLTHHNYLVCGLFASSHLQAGNSLPFRGESLQHVLNISRRVAGL